jgi:hypothetical protein
MTEREFFLDRRQAESGAFHRVLDALPRDHFDYRPHDRSPSARELVWTLASETRAGCDLIDSGRLDWRHQPPPGDPTQIVSDFQRGYRALSERATAVDQEAWQRPVQFLVEGKLMQEPPLGQFLWYLPRRGRGRDPQPAHPGGTGGRNAAVQGP